MLENQRRMGVSDRERRDLHNYHNKIWYHIRKEEETRKKFTFFGVSNEEAKQLEVHLDRSGSRAIRDNSRRRERSRSRSTGSRYENATRGRQGMAKEVIESRQSRSADQLQKRNANDNADHCTAERSVVEPPSNEKGRTEKKDYEAIWREAD